MKEKTIKVKTDISEFVQKLSILKEHFADLPPSILPLVFDLFNTPSNICKVEFHKTKETLLLVYKPKRILLDLLRAVSTGNFRRVACKLVDAKIPYGNRPGGRGPVPKGIFGGRKKPRGKS